MLFLAIYRIVGIILAGMDVHEDTDPFAELFRFIWVLCFIITVIWSIFLVIIAVGLWTGKQWARIIMIIFACFILVTFIISVVSSDKGINIIDIIISIIHMIIYPTIGAYLLFSNEAKSYFKMAKKIRK